MELNRTCNTCGDKRKNLPNAAIMGRVQLAFCNNRKCTRFGALIVILSDNVKRGK